MISNLYDNRCIQAWNITFVNIISTQSYTTTSQPSYVVVGTKPSVECMVTTCQSIPVCFSTAVKTISKHLLDSGDEYINRKLCYNWYKWGENCIVTWYGATGILGRVAGQQLTLEMSGASRNNKQQRLFLLCRDIKTHNLINRHFRHSWCDGYDAIMAIANKSKLNSDYIYSRDPWMCQAHDVK